MYLARPNFQLLFLLIPLLTRAQYDGTKPIYCIAYEGVGCQRWTGGIACCQDVTTNYKGYYLWCNPETGEFELGDCGAKGKICVYTNPNQCLRDTVRD
jgi:hypothetical protein